MKTYDPFSLEGRVALVTGATSGPGGAMVEALASAGANVVRHGLVEPPEETMAAVRAHGRRAAPVVGDLSLPATALRLVDEAEAALGPVDVLVNNAGTIRRAPAAEHSDEDWDLVLAVDLSSPFRPSREVGKRLIARGARGKTVNVASLLSFLGGPLVSSYAAATGGSPSGRRPSRTSGRRRGSTSTSTSTPPPRLHEDRRHRRPSRRCEPEPADPRADPRREVG